MTALSVAAIGECMIELSGAGGDTWTLGYAGDTFNTLWAMRTLLPADAELDYVTAFGDDPFSEGQKQFFARHRIGIAKSPTVAGSRPGLYAITLDGSERSFTYWREGSAATRLAEDREALRNSLRERNLVYFSGISLAILAPADREAVLADIGRAREGGAIVAFDPNYRKRLWKSAEEARQNALSALSVSDIALPTFSDECELFGDSDPSNTIERCLNAGVSEIVVKCGSDPAYLQTKRLKGKIAAEVVEAPLDTTGAGDAFNGGYLAARLLAVTEDAAVRKAHAAAAVAIRVRGALVPSGQSPNLTFTESVADLKT